MFELMTTYSNCLYDFMTLVIARFADKCGIIASDPDQCFFFFCIFVTWKKEMAFFPSNSHTQKTLQSVNVWEWEVVHYKDCDFFHCRKKESTKTLVYQNCNHTLCNDSIQFVLFCSGNLFFSHEKAHCQLSDSMKKFQTQLVL